MTREDIMAMKPGRELDALVAERIMRIRVQKVHLLESSKVFPGVKHTGEYEYSNLPRYSTDISDVWEIVKRMKQFLLYLKADGSFYCYYQLGSYNRSFKKVHASTAPEAICKASLLACLEV